MSLTVSLTQQRATATLQMAGNDPVSLDAHGLQIHDVRVDGHTVPWSHDEGTLVVGDHQALEIDYAFEQRSSSDGWLSTGTTLLWPYHCGNLFPCNPDPRDGLRFELHIDESDVVYPAAVATEAPAYMLGWARGDYTRRALGSTDAGTDVSVWYLPGGEQRAVDGTADLTGAVDYFEKTLGPYAFGNHVGSVEADWSGGAYGGMEHHPYWHVGSDSMGDATTHAHEAAHGWYGDGVRIACWEDFVLSEGTVSYLTAKAIEHTTGSADQVWQDYRQRLTSSMASSALKTAWPEGCGEIDVLEDKLFSSIPYMKGAFFFRALEQRVGAEALLSALGSFYQAKVGAPARMSELIEHIAHSSGYDPSYCADKWLRQQQVPDEGSCS